MKTPVMVNGLPGDMATEVARQIVHSDDFRLWPHAFTGPKEKPQKVSVEGVDVELYDPSRRVFSPLSSYFYEHGIIVDFTLGSATESNVEWYCRKGWPFVMGTTKINKSGLERMVKNSDISAVIDTNMALPIVALKKVIRDFAVQNPNCFSGYVLRVLESHQNGKIDPSGTAVDMVGYFNTMGIVHSTQGFEVSDIKYFNLDSFSGKIGMVRNPEIQRDMSIHEKHLKGQGWHNYMLRPPAASSLDAVNALAVVLKNHFLESPAFLGYTSERSETNYASVIDRTSPDRNVFFRLVDGVKGNLQLRHDVNGRSVYGNGTLDALRFLRRRTHLLQTDKDNGKVYSMAIVLEELGNIISHQQGHP